MKKKILAVLLGVGLIVSMSGFTTSDVAKEVYAKASAKSENLTGRQSNMSMTAVMKMGGSSILMDMDMELLEQQTGEDYAMSGKGTVSVLGTEQPTEYYYKDGNLYMKVGEEKLFMPMSIADAMAQMEAVGGNGANATVDMMQSASLEKLADGTSRINYKIDTKKMGNMMDSMMGAMGVGVVADTKVDLEAISGTAFVNKGGMIEKEILRMNFSADIDGETVDYAASTAINVQKLPKGVQIVYPSDLDTYKAMPTELATATVPAAVATPAETVPATPLTPAETVPATPLTPAETVPLTSLTPAETVPAA